MKRLTHDYDPAEIAAETAKDAAENIHLLPMTVDHDPAAIAEAILEANGGHEPQLDLGRIIYEYKQLREGIMALAEDLSNSSDMAELRLLVATVQEFRFGLIRAPQAAERRLSDLERWERNNTLWMAGEYL